MTKLFDLNYKTPYTVWACGAEGEDLVYATNLTQWDADLICNEMNSIDDTMDYRVAVWDGAELYHNHIKRETIFRSKENTMTYDLTSAKTYSVWACYADKPDELIAYGLKQWNADLCAEEMNLATTDFPELVCADYRVCEDN